jgi:hypothetical protein
MGDCWPLNSAAGGEMIPALTRESIIVSSGGNPRSQMASADVFACCMYSDSPFVDPPMVED